MPKQLFLVFLYVEYGYPDEIKFNNQSINHIMTLKPHMSPYVLTIINPKSRNADNVGFIYQKYLISHNSTILSLITEFYQ